MAEQEVAPKISKPEQPRRAKCPKHTKTPKMVKMYAALGRFTNKADRNHYIRSTATVIHNAEHRAKKAFAPRQVSDAAARATASDKAAE